MNSSQAERIDQINGEVVALLLKRKKVQRYSTWAQEESINNDIQHLEDQIKAIRNE